MEEKFTIDNFEYIASLGKGAYGEVILARRKSDSELVAIKVLNKNQLVKEKKQYQVFIEKEVLQRLNFVGVIKLLHSFQDKESLYFGIEYCEGGDFASYIDKNCKLLPPESLPRQVGKAEKRGISIGLPPIPYAMRCTECASSRILHSHSRAYDGKESEREREWAA